MPIPRAGRHHAVVESYVADPQRSVGGGCTPCIVAAGSGRGATAAAGVRADDDHAVRPPPLGPTSMLFAATTARPAVGRPGRGGSAADDAAGERVPVVVARASDARPGQRCGRDRPRVGRGSPEDLRRGRSGRGDLRGDGADLLLFLLLERVRGSAKRERQRDVIATAFLSRGRFLRLPFILLFFFFFFFVGTRAAARPWRAWASGCGAGVGGSASRQARRRGTSRRVSSRRQRRVSTT